MIKEFKAADIKNLRMTLGLTQILFGISIGIEQSNIGRWESGRCAANLRSCKMLTGAERVANAIALLRKRKIWTEENQAKFKAFIGHGVRLKDAAELSRIEVS